MVNMAKRIEELRDERGLSRPALASELGFPRLSIEKFETGRQTPTKEQQEKLCSFFGVSIMYLKGETDDRTRMDNWMSAASWKEEEAPKQPVKKQEKVKAEEHPGGMLEAMLASDSVQTMLKKVVLETLKTPEGKKIIADIIKNELK